VVQLFGLCYMPRVRFVKGRSGGEIEWKFTEVNTRAVSRGQNELIGKLKMAVSDMISIRE
jgi:hypothetical protein